MCVEPMGLALRVTLHDAGIYAVPPRYLGHPYERFVTSSTLAEAGSSAPSAASAGSVMRMVVPFPGRLSAVISPPIARTSPRAA